MGSDDFNASITFGSFTCANNCGDNNPIISYTISVDPEPPTDFLILNELAQTIDWSAATVEDIGNYILTLTTTMIASDAECFYSTEFSLEIQSNCS